MKSVKGLMLRAALPLLLLTSHGPSHADESWIADEKGCKHLNPHAVPDESVTWSGACVDGLAEGEGTRQWLVRGKMSSVFTGTLTQGRRGPGQGVLTSADGSSYEGDFADGQFAGHGVYRWARGDSYDGDFVDGKEEGHGILRSAEGFTVEGSFVAGQLTGHGVMRSDKGETYEGDFVDGKRTGHGIARWAEGSSFEGEFVDGMPVGRGLTRFPNGDSAEAEFAGGKIVARGQLHADESICPKMPAPNLPAVSNWTGVAIFQSVVTVEGGRITDVLVRAMSPLADDAVRDAFVNAITTTLKQDYVCTGDHVFEREFEFRVD